MTKNLACRARRVAATVLLIPAAGGCYRYHSAATESVTVGMQVRARLSLRAAERIAEVVVATDEGGRVVEGRLLENERTSLVMLVPTAGGVMNSARLGQRLRLEPGDILELESKHLDRRRTGLLVGAGALITAAVVIRQLRDSGEGLGPNPRDGGPTELVVPAWVRLRIPF